MLPDAISKIKPRRKEAVQVFTKALELDDDITPHVIANLRKLNATESAEAIRPFLTHRWRLVEVEAPKALKKFGVIAEAPKPIGINVTRKSLPAEASINLDADDIPGLLRDINKYLDVGFTEAEITGIYHAAEELKDDQHLSFEFLVTHHGEETRLRVVLDRGDEIYFFTSEALAQVIGSVMDDKFM